MRKWMVALMVVLTIGLAGGVFWIMTTSDHEGPEIIFDKDKDDRYEEGMENSELLEGVKAKDERDGDVSDTLTVESVYKKDGGKEVTVIFVAKDSNNNVTKEEFTMLTEEGAQEKEKKEEDEKKDESEPKPETPDEPANAAIGTDAETPSEAPAEPDIPGVLSKEEQAKKEQEEKIEKLAPQAPRMYLTTYYLQIPVGTPIDRLSYVADIKDDVDETNVLWRAIQIDGTLDVNTPGTYELTYFVVDSNGNSSNGAVLTVVVE